MTAASPRAFEQLHRHGPGASVYSTLASLVRRSTRCRSPASAKHGAGPHWTLELDRRHAPAPRRKPRGPGPTLAGQKYELHGSAGLCRATSLGSCLLPGRSLPVAVAITSSSSHLHTPSGTALDDVTPPPISNPPVQALQKGTVMLPYLYRMAVATVSFLADGESRHTQKHEYPGI